MAIATIDSLSRRLDGCIASNTVVHGFDDVIKSLSICSGRIAIKLSINAGGKLRVGPAGCGRTIDGIGIDLITDSARCHSARDRRHSLVRRTLSSRFGRNVFYQTAGC